MKHVAAIAAFPPCANDQLPFPKRKASGATFNRTEHVLHSGLEMHFAIANVGQCVAGVAFPALHHARLTIPAQSSPNN